ncbi:MAG: TolC family protein [bacterium]
MNVWKTTVFLCLPGLVCAGSVAFAKAPVLTLAQAQADAEADSPSQRSLDAKVKAADARVDEAFSEYLPRLDVNAQHLFGAQYGSMSISFPAISSSGLNFPSAFPQDTVDIHAAWNFFDGLRSTKQMQAACAEAKAARLERDYAAFRLRQQVAVLFYKALASRLLVSAAQADMATLDEHLRLARDYEDSGGATHFGVLRVQAQREEALASLQQAQDGASMSRLDLAQAMGLSRDARALWGSLPVPSMDEVPDSLAPNLADRDDLKALGLRRDALRRDRAAVLSSWAPSLSLFADQEYYRYGDFNPEILATSGFPYQRMFGISATWNLFDGGLDKSRLDEADAQIQVADAGLDDARLAASKDFASWKDRFRDGVRLYQASLRVLQESKESVRLARLGLKAGTLTDSEVLDSEMDLFKTRAGLVQAQADAAEALLNLELLSGKSLAR